MNAPVPQIAAVVVNHDRRELLAASLESVERGARETGVELELAVVDNGSRDGSATLVSERFPRATLLALDVNVGFAGAVNLAVARTSAEWILLLNNDATLDRSALRHLLEATAAPNVGAIAAQQRFAARPDRINSAGIGLDVLGVAFDRLLGAPVEASEPDCIDVFGASAGAALYRRAMLDQVGGFDSRFFVYLEDVDLAWRAGMAGWRTLYAPQAVAWHHHASTARHGSPFKYFHVGRNRVRMLARNADRRQLRRHAVAIVAYDLAYVAFVAAREHSIAPLLGRLAGLREWRSYRREGAALRRPVSLEPRRGLRAALGRRAAWSQGGTTPGDGPTPA